MDVRSDSRSWVPEYISRSVPVPAAKRVPWYRSTFPTYASIFLWVGFYLKLAEPTLGQAGIGTCILGLLAAGLLCFGLYYYVPGMLGMQTGRPLYVVGSSTFGASGGYLIPGLLMGLLQLGWLAVGSDIAAQFIMHAMHLTSRGLYCLLVIVWIYSVGWVAMKGIHPVAKVAKYLNWVPLIMLLVVFWANKGGISHYQPPQRHSALGFLSILTIVTGFFATAGAAGADFGMNNRNRRDVVLGGIFGIIAGALIAGGIPLLSVAGYLGRTPGASSYDYTAAILAVGALAPATFFLFTAASFAPNCFSCFIAANSFDTMLPRIPRSVATFVAISISAILAITGVTRNLVGFFSIVGASFGPICGAMIADYLLAGRRWSGPRQGINWAGYLAWGFGFLVGIPDQIPGLPVAWFKTGNPWGIYSVLTGFVLYWILAKAGLRPPLIESSEAVPAR